MTQATDALLPKLYGSIDDWKKNRDEAWQKNKIHWAFWCGVIAAYESTEKSTPKTRNWVSHGKAF